MEKKKYYSSEEVLKKLKDSIKNPKKNKVVNKQLQGALEKIVNKIVIKHARVEALKLLKLSNEKEVGEFLYYYHSDQTNICCMVIDSIKDRLWKENVLPKRIGHSFGLECKFKLT